MVNETADQSTVNIWIIKFQGSEAGKVNIDETCSSQPVSVTDVKIKRQKEIDKMIQNDHCTMQQDIVNWVHISKKQYDTLLSS